MADTGYLLCFGVKGGQRLLRTLHTKGVAAPEAVHRELDGLVRSRRGGVTDAARSFEGRGRAIVERVPFDPVDEPLRESLLDQLHALDKHADGPRNPSSTKNHGEAECVCLCLRGDSTLLCNDSGGRAVAKSRGVATITTAEDLRRLVGEDFTPKQVLAIAREMERQVNDLGAVVSGVAFFRPPPTPPGLSQGGGRVG